MEKKMENEWKLGLYPVGPFGRCRCSEWRGLRTQLLVIQKLWDVYELLSRLPFFEGTLNSDRGAFCT